jgi:hypothetical protein
MIAPTYLYTVLVKENGCFVRYIDLESCEVERLKGIFTNSREAAQAFEAITGEAHSCYLSQQRFSQNVRSLAQYKRLDKQRGG